MFGKKKYQEALAVVANYQRGEELRKKLEQGIDALSKGQDSYAFRIFTELNGAVTEASTPDLFGSVQYLLGVCYHDGYGVARDFNKAFRCFFNAAKHGLDDAKRALAVCYYFGRGVAENPDAAMRLLLEIVDSDIYDDNGVDEESLGEIYGIMAEICILEKNSKYYNPQNGVEYLRMAIGYGDENAMGLAKRVGLL